MTHKHAQMACFAWVSPFLDVDFKTFLVYFGPFCTTEHVTECKYQLLDFRERHPVLAHHVGSITRSFVTHRHVVDDHLSQEQDKTRFSAVCGITGIAFRGMPPDATLRRIGSGRTSPAFTLEFDTRFTVFTHVSRAFAHVDVHKNLYFSCIFPVFSL